MNINLGSFGYALSITKIKELENELEENNTHAKIAHVSNNGKQVYETKYYNLDMIIYIGFRIK